tara:strand:+ start:82 stop:621 length:540 start_codon:yes stop_codon:yes gene_type:complete
MIIDSHIYKKNLISFIIGILVSIFFNHLNLLAYNINHLYYSPTLIYAGLIGASNSVWSYQIIRFFSSGKFNLNIFILGLWAAIFLFFMLRSQIFVDDETYIKRMISHDSTAITTSKKILDKTIDSRIKNFALETIELIENRINTMEKLLLDYQTKKEELIKELDESEFISEDIQSNLND